MNLRWTSKALSDVARVRDFLRPVNPHAARRAVLQLFNDLELVARNPRIGEAVEVVQFNGREVRRVFIGDYELRYEVRPLEIIVLRVWHVREDR